MTTQSPVMAKTQSFVRPEIMGEVGTEFRDFCKARGLMQSFAATSAIAEWLQKQKQAAEPVAADSN